MSRLFASLIARTTNGVGVLQRRRPALFEVPHAQPDGDVDSAPREHRTEVPVREYGARQPQMSAHEGVASRDEHVASLPAEKVRAAAAVSSPEPPESTGTAKTRVEVRESVHTIRVRESETDAGPRSDPTQRRRVATELPPIRAPSFAKTPLPSAPQSLRRDVGAQPHASGEISHGTAVDRHPLLSSESPRRVHPLRAAQPQAVSPSAPTVHVTIGRIEVRAAAAPEKTKPARAPRPTLADYLRSRDGGSR